MSLVDYASSSDDDVSDSEHEPPQQRHEPPPAPPPRRPPSPPKTLESGSSAVQKPETLEKLPDASMLLNSPTVPLTSGNDHASVSVPDTGGGSLVPPQLRGRSNVVTEDISKLFINRHVATQPKGPEN
ncbi:hypothetical protein Goklo_000217 [Gossypium klotzschianum]|nr:hypothetical protein [Gossypium klotzschianum]